MKITCAKRSREEIIKDRDEYDAKRKAIHDQADAERINYWKAVDDVYNSVRDEVESQLSNFIESLNLNIQVDSGWRNNIQVRVRSNENNVHGKDKALSWDWSAQLTREGELKKESGSWSGLQAVTEVQLESLRQSVACLEILNSIDWVAILSKPLPNADEYFTIDAHAVDDNRPNYESELMEAEIDEAIQNGSWIKGHGYKYYLKRATVYYKVLKETPAQYEVLEVWENNLKNGDTNIHPYKIKKDTFFQVIDTPIEVYEG